jgi:hypothetical protein
MQHAQPAAAHGPAQAVQPQPAPDQAGLQMVAVGQAGPAHAQAPTTAAQLKAALAPANLANPAGQMAAFDAAASYQGNPARAGHVRVAVANSASNVAATAALTFGTGRVAGSAATGGAVVHGEDPAHGAIDPGRAAANQAVNVLATAVLGTAGNMVAQTVVPGAVDLVMPKKMAAIPAQALVPQQMDAHGAPVPLSDAQTQARADIKATQARLSNVGSHQNALTGAATFAGAQIARFAADSPNPTAGLVGWGASAAVSAVGGASLGGVMAGRMANATHAVPDPHGAPGSTVDMKLFYPQPTAPKIAPPWLGNAAQVAQSGLARTANLAVAGVPLQTAVGAGETLGRVIENNAGAHAAGAAVHGAAMAVAAGAYFKGLGLIGPMEAGRAQAGAAAAQAAQPAPAQDIEAQHQGPGAAQP